MTTLSIAAGTFSAGMALLVLCLYAVATVRGCVGWRLGVHVVIVALVEVMLVVLATITTLQLRDQLEQLQPWRAPLTAALFTLLSVGLLFVITHVRERVTTSCTRGHRDWFHGG